MNINHKISLPGKILEISPVSVYEGKTFTQVVKVVLENGVKLLIYDVHKYSESADVGCLRELYVTASTLSPQHPLVKNEMHTKYIVPSLPANDEPTYWAADYSGCLEAIEIPEGLKKKPYQFPYLGIVDVGVGNIAVPIFNEDFNRFRTGDYIQATAASLYLKGIV